MANYKRCMKNPYYKNASQTAVGQRDKTMVSPNIQLRGQILDPILVGKARNPHEDTFSRILKPEQKTLWKSRAKRFSGIKILAHFTVCEFLA